MIIASRWLDLPVRQYTLRPNYLHPPTVCSSFVFFSLTRHTGLPHHDYCIQVSWFLPVHTNILASTCLSSQTQLFICPLLFYYIQKHLAFAGHPRLLHHDYCHRVPWSYLGLAIYLLTPAHHRPHTRPSFIFFIFYYTQGLFFSLVMVDYLTCSFTCPNFTVTCVFIIAS